MWLCSFAQTVAEFGADRDSIRIHGDVVNALDVEWEAEADPDRVINP